MGARGSGCGVGVEGVGGAVGGDGEGDVGGVVGGDGGVTGGVGVGVDGGVTPGMAGISKICHPDQTGVIQSIGFLNEGIFVGVSIESAGDSRQRITPLNRVGRKSTGGSTSGVGGDEVG